MSKRKSKYELFKKDEFIGDFLLLNNPILCSDHRVRCEVQCKCGNKFIAHIYNLLKQKGCTQCRSNNKRINLVGQKFNRLTAIEVEYRISNNGKRLKRGYKCQCDCGNTTYVDTSKLKNGLIKSCGCSHKDVDYGKSNRKRWGESIENKTIDMYIRQAKSRGYSFDISKEHAIFLFKQNCFYCNSSIKRCISPKAYGDYYRNGIDRKDNTLGYTIDNCVSCCTECNQRKRAMFWKDFIKWARNITENTKDIIIE